MKRPALTLPLLIPFILFVGGIILVRRSLVRSRNEINLPTRVAKQTNANMKITSSAFSNNENIPSKYTCDGKNVNPPLIFSEVPMESKSLALIVDDPDAPAGIWTHWVVFNIPPNVLKIEENTVPPNAIQGVTSFTTNKYGGPCPPSGTHHYHFKLFALDSKLNISEKSDSNALINSMNGHIIEETQLVGLYYR